MSRTALLGSCALLALAVGAARADTQAIDVTSVGQIAYSPPFPTNGFNYYQTPGGYTFSWDFTANSAIQVTQLGYYDSVLAGTAEPPGGFGTHTLTLSDVTTNTTLVTTYVTSTSPATGVFNYQPIAPVTLNTSDTYQISGDMTTQYYLVGLNQSAAPTAPQINYQFAGGGTLFGYTPPPGTYGDFGPNFQFIPPCTQNRRGINIIALSGDACTAAPGPYNPTTSTVTLPVTYNGFGFYANGGSIDSPGNVTITTADPNGTGGSHAIWADGIGSKITLEGSTTITAGGANSYGVYASGAGLVSATGAVSVTTTGAGAIAVNADSGGAITLGGAGVTTTLRTSGDGAHAVSATGAGSIVTLAGASNLTTTGNGAIGIFAGAGGIVNATGPVTISTSGTNAQVSGLSSFGVNADGSGSTITLGAATITTAGQGAVGLMASDNNATGAGGLITVNGALTVTTQATYGYDVYANAAGAKIALNGTTTLNVGTGSFGINATGGGAVTTAGNLTIAAGAAGFGGGVQADGGSVALGGASSIKLTSTNLVGLFAVGGGTITTSAALTLNAGANLGMVAQQGGAIQLGAAAAVTTTGAGNLGAYATDGGAIRATGPLSVSTTGAGATALYVTGAGSVINAALGVVSTSGARTFGAEADNGGNLTLTGGSIATGGATSDGVLILSGAAVNLSGVQVSTGGNGAKGIAVQGTGTTFTGSNLTISTSGGTDTATGYNASGVYNGNGNGSSGGSTGGAVVSLTNSMLTTSGGIARGVITENGGATTISGGSVTTSGVQSDAVYGSSGSTTTLTNVQLTTSGNAAKGIDIEGTGTQLTGSGLTISTSGTIDTATGFHAQGVYNGSSGPASAGETGGGVVSLTQTSVTTKGASSFGVDTENGGSTTFTGGSIATSGAGAVGLAVNDAGTTVTATNVTITTKGGIDTATNDHANGVYNGPGTGTSGGTLTLNNVSVTTAGFESSGVVTSNGGTSTIAGGTFSTSGENAGAVVVLGSGKLQISGATLTASGLGGPGLVINGSGGSVVASNLTISTTGQISTATGSHGDGVYNGPFGGYSGGGTMSITDSSVSTSGDQAYAVSTGAGGTTTFLGGSISTTGAQANAAIANAGSLTIGLDATGHGTTISTSGAGSYAVNANNGGYLSLTGASITTANDGGGGIGVNGTGSEVDATNVTISTAGAYDSVSGNHAYGAYNGPDGSITSGGVLKLTNVSVSTQGAGMYGVYTATGGVTTFNGGSVTTSGGGADGLHVSGAGATATLNGAVGVTVSGAGAAGVYVGAGGAVTATGALTVKAATYGLYVNGGALSLSGALSLTTTASGAALTLNGAGASFTGSGGGLIDATGTAIALLNGASQSASFANYQINSPQGDLIYADPSTSTVNFGNTSANAGTGNLADVTNGSDLTLNANASALTGVITTTAGSTSNVNLQNGSNWTITGSSTVTNLSLSNSSAAFAPGGGFKTLTTTNYAGTNATLTFNAAFGGTNPGADQLVINGGRATGTTVIAVNPLGTASGRASVPLVTTTNGGTIAPGAFTLTGPLVVGGLVYTLQDQAGAENLVAGQGITPAQASGSLATLAQSRQTQAITGHVLGSILTGATEQINCSACSSGFASFGSFALGAHGRWTLTPSVALLAGLSYDSYSGRGVTVNNAVLGAMALRYDPAQLGRYRPFLEAGLLAEPYANVSFRRGYTSAVGQGVGVGDTLSRSVAAYGRIGYIWRLSRIDEAAAYTDLTKSWQWEAGYVESAGAGNPFGAAVAPSLDTMNVWRLGAQYTHLFGEHVEADVSVGYAQAFAANYGSTAAFAGLGGVNGAAPSSFGWGELGGRVSYRFSRNVTGDLFVLGTVGAEPAGNQIHGGAALRMAF